MQDIKIIGFDADDTLWISELYYRQGEDFLAYLLKEYALPEQVKAQLFDIEMQNMELYGYGAKAFTLSLIEAAIKISHYKVDAFLIEKLTNQCKKLIDIEIELLPGVRRTLEQLAQKYPLILATKGDLLDQERKLNKSGLSQYFYHIEVMSDKKVKNYQALLKYLAILPENFLMIGNSVRSDILPLVEIGAKAVHIPFHSTWVHEKVELSPEQEQSFIRIENIEQVLEILKRK